MREVAQGFKVVLAGLTNDLSTCRAELGKSVPKKGVHVYTRLNVSRVTRHAEHEDALAAT